MVELFLKECKQIGKSLVYFIFIGVVAAFYFSQFYAEIPTARSKEPYDPRKSIEKPVYIEDLEAYRSKHYVYPYGETREELPDQIIPKATTRLYNEYINESYMAWPMGLAKNVKLSEKETGIMEGILEKITGKSIVETKMMWENGKWEEVLKGISIDYTRFKEYMEEVDNIIGGGSQYSKENLKNFGKRPKTYEEALKEYTDLIEKDKITNGYARLFSDYIGIVLGLFPVFVTVFFMLRDRKSNMHQLIYSKGISSFKLIICRYIALVLMMMLPVLFLAAFSTGTFIGIGKDLNASIDYLAFIKYSIGWLLPTIMAVTALGMFFTLLTDSITAILVQIVWFFQTLFTGGLGGDYDITQLIIRFNTSREREIFIACKNDILINRLFFIALSAALVGASIHILNLKREGRIDIYAKLRKYSSAITGKSKNSLCQ